MIPKTHPRYKSLLLRDKVKNAFKEGYLADSGMIAHGRGETFDYLIGEKTTETAKKACEDVAINIQKPNIEYKYYDSCEGINWWEEKKLKEIDATIKLFWRTCYDKQIVGDEFAKLYDLLIPPPICDHPIPFT